MAKAGIVSIIGKPNVGKSTLMNTMIGQKLAITSYKPQTTRKQMRTVFTDERGQIVFLDTPGILRGRDLCRTKLGGYMELAAESSLQDADVILWLVEASRGKGTVITAQDRAVLELLKNPEAKIKAPVILVISKIDQVKKGRILEIIDAYSKEYDFRAVIPVSARTKTGTDDLIQTVFDLLPEGEPFYDEDTVTDENERDIVSEIIREKALRLLQDEVPHGIAVVVDSFKYRKGRSGKICDISATIITDRENHKGIIIGKNGEMNRKSHRLPHKPAPFCEGA